MRRPLPVRCFGLSGGCRYTYTEVGHELACPFFRVPLFDEGQEEWHWGRRICRRRACSLV